MPSVSVYFTDGTHQRFEERGRAGGSYSMTLRFEGNFAIITDEYGKQTIFPGNRIQHIEQDAPQRSW